MECVQDTSLIIIIVVSFLSGFAFCYISNMKNEFKDIDDSFNDRIG